MKAAIRHASGQPMTLYHLISAKMPLAAINDGFDRLRAGGPARQLIGFAA